MWTRRPENALPWQWEFRNTIWSFASERWINAQPTSTERHVGLKTEGVLGAGLPYPKQVVLPAHDTVVDMLARVERPKPSHSELAAELQSGSGAAQPETCGATGPSILEPAEPFWRQLVQQVCGEFFSDADRTAPECWVPDSPYLEST